MRNISILLMMLVLAGCETESATAPEQQTLPPVSFVVFQRSTADIPGTEGGLRVRLGDITRGQVRTSVLNTSGQAVANPRSMRPNDFMRVSWQGTAYYITLKSLRNELVGNDSAAFTLSLVAENPQSGMSENDLIHWLIESLGTFDDAIFIRNGENYSIVDAQTHLKRKWGWHANDITTAEDFIRLVATASSESGEAYRVRLADGTELMLEQILSESLAAMRRIE